MTRKITRDLRSYYNHWNSYKFPYLNSLLLTASFIFAISIDCEYDNQCGVHYETNQVITNWSNTHVSHPQRIYEPKSAQEVARLVQYFTRAKEKVRPIGSYLSPNGIGMNGNKNLLSLNHLDYIKVDKNRMLVTVGAGARVSDVLKELSKYDLTLENFSSIQEQQIAGWTQVSAHGTGISLPTVDEMISDMNIALPSGGIVNLSSKHNSDLFYFCKVGLGSLGIVTELTLKCIPKLNLHEKLTVEAMTNIDSSHINRLKEYRHVRYMWIPYTDNVVIVTSNPTSKPSALIETLSTNPTAPLSNLLLQINPSLRKDVVYALSFSQLRDLLLDHNPLDVNHIKQVNRAEAKFWESSCGDRIDDSTNILGFDCGGEQWVYEICIPIGSKDNLNNNDITFVKKLLETIELNQIPAPSPIEQRWTGRSLSPMSPAYSSNKDEIFSWVGIIMYLPPNQNEDQRQQITESFQKYCKLLQPLIKEYKGVIHWAKIELPSETEDLNELKNLLKMRYPLNEFNTLRKSIDPSNILSNELIDNLFDIKSSQEK